eukprot:NODE_7708_length_1556_cov_10.497551.p2 GENE.NODE_7708_length_1556_cov_10.497551~~NODE_7708_length_1556_cov_10.497551.p2  ORF type:complete len:210 (-),score=64.66 NODE_7708_length_1556_cov_10.497551:114-743(-)
MLEIPEKETVTRALKALTVWCAQAWNYTFSEDADAAARAPRELNDVIHASTLRIANFASGVLRPVTRLIVAPPQATSIAFGNAPRDALVGLVQHAWAGFVTPTPGTPSELVHDTQQVVLAVMMVLTKHFKLVCHKLGVPVRFEELYLCPPLFEAAKVLYEMPNTRQNDVVALFELFLDEQQPPVVELRSKVRAVLHEASPTFRSAAVAL